VKAALQGAKPPAAAQSCPFGSSRQRAPSRRLVTKGLQVPAVLLGKGRLLMLSTSAPPPHHHKPSLAPRHWQNLTASTLEDETCPDSAAEGQYPLCTITDALAGLKNNAWN